MPSDQSNARVEQLNWTAIVVGKELPDQLTEALRTGYGSWVSSEENCEFPMDIIIGLDQPAQFYRVDIGAKGVMAPKKILFKIGRQEKERRSPRGIDEEQPKYVDLKYERAKSAKYCSQGSLFFEEIDDQLLEDRVLVKNHVFPRHSGLMGQWLWMIVDGPALDEQRNPLNQICLTSLIIYGTTTHNLRNSSSLSKENSFVSRRYTKTRRPSPSLDSFSLSYWDEENGYHRRKSAGQSNRDFAESYQPLSSAEEEDSEFFYDLNNKSLHHLSLFSSRDHLEALHLVGDVLLTKRKQAMKNHRTVEAQFCLRAVERIKVDVQKMQDLKKKLSSAQLHNNEHYVAHYKTALKDVRDTCFRSIHLDLLLNQNEVAFIWWLQWNLNDKSDVKVHWINPYLTADFDIRLRHSIGAELLKEKVKNSLQLKHLRQKIGEHG